MFCLGGEHDTSSCDVIKDLGTPGLRTHAVVDDPLAGTHHVVRRSFTAFPGVHAVLLPPARRVSHRARHAVGGATLVHFVVTWVIRFPPDAASDHGVVLTTFGGNVKQHGVFTLVQVLLPSGFLGRGATVVELGTLAGMSFFLLGSSGADQVGTHCWTAFIIDRSSRHAALAVSVEHTPLWAAEGDESSCRAHGELAAVRVVRPEVRAGPLEAPGCRHGWRLCGCQLSAVFKSVECVDVVVGVFAVVMRLVSRRQNNRVCVLSFVCV